MGPHCATGVPDPTRLDFDKTPGTCVMFGQDVHAVLFCDTCVTYLKARMLEDVVSDWHQRAEG